MTDIVSILSDPIVMIASVSIIAVVGAYFFFRGGSKDERVWVLERLKPGTSILHMKVKYSRKKNPGEYVLDFGNEHKYVVPEEKRGTFEDTVDDKGKHHKLWAMENGQITKFADSLATVGSALLDHATVTAAMTRASAKRLAAPKLPKGDLYLYLAMGAVVGVALGWIIYPQFNHPAPVIEYFRQLPNGTFVPLGGPVR